MSDQEDNLASGTWDAMIPLFLKNVSPAGRATLYQHFSAPPMNQSFSMSAGEMEQLILQFLTSISNSPSWENTISLVNEHRQTLAHLAVLFRYTTLLEKVAQWGIDVDAQDVNGFTALHCAYLCGDLDSVQILMGHGADDDIRDNLGRRPLDMHSSRTNAQSHGSPASDHTGTSQEWEKVSVTSPQLDSVDRANLPAAKRQQLHTPEPTASPWTMPAPIRMPSPSSGNSCSEVETWIDEVGERRLSASPIGLEESYSPPDRPDSGFCLPPTAHQSVPMSAHFTTSTNPPSHLSLSGPRAPPSRGLEATNSQGRIQSGDGNRNSPPLPIPSIQMPVPCPALSNMPVHRFPSSFGPQTAPSSASTSSHYIQPGTKAELDGRPATRPLSTGGLGTQLFAPPPHPPTVSPRPDVKATHSSIFPEENLPPYSGGPQKFGDAKKRPLREVSENEQNKTDAGRSEKQRYIVPVERLKEEILDQKQIDLAALEACVRELRLNNP